MLIENNAVQAKLFTIGHLVQVFGIVGSAFYRIEKIARYRRARSVFGNVRISEEIKII
jgi:hypothetical protein